MRRRRRLSASLRPPVSANHNRHIVYLSLHPAGARPQRGAAGWDGLQAGMEDEETVFWRNVTVHLGVKSSGERPDRSRL